MTLLNTLTAHPAPIRQDEDGVLRIGDTRVQFESVVGAFKDGSAAEEILLKYPSLDLTDIYAVITYYLWHRNEVEAYLSECLIRTEQVQQENESRFPPDGIRDRLEAHREKRP